MEAIYSNIADFILHFDRYLPVVMEAYGHWIYAFLFIIVFCETGLVVTPFLPGDSYVKKAEDFYAKHGHKAIFLARFAPIVRTFAPFVAGIGTMHYRTFAIYNVSGACTWVFLFLGGGYFFGNIPFIKQNFSYVTMGIILFSLTPIIFEVIRSRRAK